jgi:hypothetical protein
MTRKKILPDGQMPFALVDELLRSHGFRLRNVGTENQPHYQISIQDASTHTCYQLYIPVHVTKHRADYVRVGKAYIKEEKLIPDSVLWAIQCKLREISDYMCDITTFDLRVYA